MRSKRGTLPTLLARLRADALRAAGLSVLPTSLCIGLRFCRTAGRFLRVRTLTALENWLMVCGLVGFDPRRTSTLRRCLATGLALHRYGLWSLRLPTPSATPLIKSESKRPVSICLVAGLLPWFGLRRPYGIHAFGHARDDWGDAMDRNPLEHLPAP